MSRGQSQPRSQQVKRVLERCKTRGSIEIIDVDKDKADVIIIDAPETSHQGSRYSRATRNCFPSVVISIDDEEGGNDDTLRSVHADTAGKEFCPTSSNSSTSAESQIDECLMSTGKRNSSFNSNMRRCHEVGTSVNRFGLGLTSETSISGSDSSDFDSESITSENITSESDSSDCEILEDSSGNIREQWERAAVRKKMSERGADPGMPSEEATQSKIDIENCINKVYSNHSKEIPAESSPNNLSNGKENLSFNMPADAELSDSFFKTKANTTYGDKDPTTDIGHEETEHICPHRAQSTYETPSSNNLSGLGQSKLYHEPKNKDDDVSSLDKDEPVPTGTTSNTNGLHGEASFQDKVSPSPGQLSSCDLQPLDGKQSSPHSAIQEKNENILGEHSYFTQPQGASVDSAEITSFQEKEKSVFKEPSLCNFRPSDSPLFNVYGATTLEEPPFCNSNAGRGTTDRIHSSGTGSGHIPLLDNDLICERERHKESDEYKRAVEEEWAARQHQLQIQAEEAQRLRRRRKAESLRLLDMERRQKQRLEEIRESQKKDEETINLKEHLRAEVRKELEKMEFRYKDMASLLRGLGIHVEGGHFPMPHEVNAAYKQALLRFHPDRASRNDIHQQVKSEETFKLISRLKEKLLPVI